MCSNLVSKMAHARDVAILCECVGVLVCQCVSEFVRVCQCVRTCVCLSYLFT